MAFNASIEFDKLYNIKLYLAVCSDRQDIKFKVIRLIH